MFLACGGMLAGYHGHDGHGAGAMRGSDVRTVAFDAKGVLWSVLYADGSLTVSSSKDLGATFTEPVRLNPAGPEVSVSEENRPQIAVDAAGHVFVTYTQAAPGRFNGLLMFSRSVDGGASFSVPRQVNDDTQPTGHAFASMGLSPDGKLYLVWIDGRDRVEAEAAGETFIGSSLYAAVSTDQGASFSTNQSWVRGICQCCRLAMDFDRDHQPVLLWRHIFGDHIRDHALGRFESATGRFRFERLTRDNWRIEGCPHRGPALALAENGESHAAWFTMTGDRPELLYGATGQDGAWRRAPMLVGQAAAYPALLTQGDAVYLVWLEQEETQTRLLGMYSRNGGADWSEPREIQAVAGQADHPALLQNNGSVYVAWQSAAGFTMKPFETRH